MHKTRQIFLGYRWLRRSWIDIGFVIVVATLLSGNTTVPPLSQDVQPTKTANPAKKSLLSPTQDPLKSPAQKIEPPPATPAPKPKAEPLVFAPPSQFRGATFYQATLGDKTKAIALTFDDGPSPDTLKILAILQKYKVKATFFCLGENLREFPEIAGKVVKAGHAIGNHTWHHLYRDVDVATAAAEIDNTSVHIYRATGSKSFLFRPPGGRLKNGLADYAKKKNYVVVMWSIDPKDFQMPPASIIADTVITKARPGSVVLLHDGGGNRNQTIQALPAIVQELKKKGYQFVTIPELLAMQAASKQETAGKNPKAK